MRKLLLLLFLLSASASLRAQLYINITQAPYSANPQCASDAGPAINQAITDAVNQGVHTSYAVGSTIYFPPGCYLIKTQIQDTGNTPSGYNAIGISYLGFGRATLQAGTGLTGSIMKFGDDTHAPGRRHVAGIFFECGAVASVDGIDIDGLFNSEFDDIEVRDCVNYGIQTVGSNTASRYSLSFEGGTIVGTTSAASGIYAGPGANFWVIKGMHVASNTSTTGAGIEFEGSGDVCSSCDVEGWSTGIAAGLNGAMNGLQVSGGYFEKNVQSAIRIGSGNAAGLIGQGVAIHGAYINGYVSSTQSTARCIDLEQADGFSISGNQFSNCNNYIIHGEPDVQGQEGSDNGIVGPNNIAGSSGSFYLPGKNVTLIIPACVSSASPASCGFTASGLVALPSGANNLTVNDAFVSATSRITVSEDTTLGSQLGVTCNGGGGRTYSITSKTAGTSFVITSSAAPSGNPACLVFHMEN